LMGKIDLARRALGASRLKQSGREGPGKMPGEKNALCCYWVFLLRWGEAEARSYVGWRVRSANQEEL